MIYYSYPPQATVTIATPPIEFKKNGVDTFVSRDTVTPANSNPLPTINLDSSGNVATPLTDAQLRATPVPVSGPLTDTQLRASAVPVSAASLPLPTGAATSANQASELTLIGAVTETAPVSDTASSGLNGRLQRIAQRLSSLIALLPTSLGQKTSAASLAVTVASDQTAIPASQSGTWNIANITGAVSLPTGAATSANQASELTLIGAVTETAPVSDTASSGLNGRLQRIAQRLSSLIALFPTALGQNTMANSFAVTIASNQSALSVTQSALTGSYQEILNLTNSVQTFTAPANTKWFKIMTDDTNTANIRYKVGAAATTTSGMQLQPGRSEDNLMSGNISVICETAATNQKVYVQFGV